MSRREMCKVAVLAVFLVPVICQAELITHWKFDSNSGVTAYDSAGSNNGIIMGAQWTEGKAGNALKFDGNDDFVIASSIPDLTMSDHTVSLWVKCTPNLDSAAIICIGQSPHFGLSYTEHHASYFAGWHDNTGTGKEVVESDNPPAKGVWTHLTMRKKDGEYSLFVNGVKQNDTEQVDADFQANDTIILGAGHILNGYYFDGAIDDIRIYDTGLSDSEIQSIPEPATIALLFTGGLFLRRKRK